MKCLSVFLLSASCALLTGCDAPVPEPVVVQTPGMPNAELALSKSLDRIHAFLGSVNERVAVPARQDFALGHAVFPTPSVAVAKVDTPPEHLANGLEGTNGTLWYAFGAGTPEIRCTPQSVCLMALQPGEIPLSGSLSADDPHAGWHADLLKTASRRKNAHMTPQWTVALQSQPGAEATTLHIATSKRTYVPLLSPEGPDTKRVQFIYDSRDQTSQPDYTGHIKSKQPDFHYTMNGADMPWKPLRIYTDQGKTYIEFPEHEVTQRPHLVIFAPKDPSIATQIIADSYVVSTVLTDFMLIDQKDPSMALHIHREGTPS